MLNRDTIKKAILLESNALLGHQKNGTDINPTTLLEVVSFYAQLREAFQFKVDFNETDDDNFGYDARKSRQKDILKWADENDILMFNGRTTDIYYFSTAEDATAFKLKWL